MPESVGSREALDPTYTKWIGSESMSAEARLKELGLVLPVLAKPTANYLPYRIAGNLLFLAGQGPRDENGKSLTGKLATEISIDEGYRRGRLAGLVLLAAMRGAHRTPVLVDIISQVLAADTPPP